MIQSGVCLSTDSQAHRSIKTSARQTNLVYYKSVSGNILYIGSGLDQCSQIIRMNGERNRVANKDLLSVLKPLLLFARLQHSNMDIHDANTSIVEVASRQLLLAIQ